jgi:hypothetical protein
VRRSVQPNRAVTTHDLSRTLILRMTAGTTRALDHGELLIDSTTAKSDHLSVGGTVPVKFALTGRSTMHTGGIYKPKALIGSYLVGQAFYLCHYRHPTPGALLLTTRKKHCGGRKK